MKIVREEILISCGEFVTSKAWEEIRASLHTAVKAVSWPPGSNTFTIYPERGKKRGEGNGVKPIRVGLMLDLEKLGWKVEHPARYGGKRIQASLTQCLKLTPPIVLEWENTLRHCVIFRPPRRRAICSDKK